MSDTAERLVQLLADGALHSGAKLAAELGVTRAAVWKTVADLRARGIAVSSHDRRGYQLERPVELLETAKLQAAATAVGLSLPEDCEVLFEVGSTNAYLYAAPAPPPGAPRLLFAELQTAGRGRRGREWLAPFGSGLTFSIGWTFAETPPDFSTLGLVMGVCVVRALRALGAPNVQLKWPNDIVHEHRKLGGLLTQVRSESGGPAYVVVGLGLNLTMPVAARAALAIPEATPVTDLADACSGELHSRTRVAAHVAGAMLAGLAQFARSGFSPFAADWTALDSLRNAAIVVLRHDGAVDGIARGTDADGSLLVETGAGTTERVQAGDVSLRRAGGGVDT